MKKILLAVSSLFLLLAAPFHSNAATAATGSNASIDANTLLFVNEASGLNGDTLNDLFSSSQTRASSGNPQLTDISLSVEDGLMVFESVLKYNSADIDLSTSGVLYKNEETDNSGIHSNLVFAEMDDTNGIHFVQFKFDKNRSELLIILQFTESKELLSFTIPLTTEDFNVFYNIEDNPISGKELEAKIASLYSISRNLIDTEDNTTVYEWTSPVCSTNSAPMPRGTYNGWAGLFSDLEDGSAKLSNHPDVDADFFKGTGWQHDNAWNLPYMLKSYSTTNGPSEYLTQLTLLDVTAQHYQSTDDKYQLALQFQINSGTLVSYDVYTDMLTVLYYDFGLSLEDVQIGIGKLTDNAFFINRTVSRKYLESGNLVKTFVTLYPPAEIASSVLEGLSMGTNQPATEIQYFEQTFSDQLARYQGEIIKGIVATTESNELTLPGHLINIAGLAKYDPSLGFSFTWQYSFRCFSYI